MDPISIAAASGLRSRMESLDLLANNLANASTSGYKVDREFYSLYASAEASQAGSLSTLPVIERQWTDFSQGLLQPTGNPLDLALSGRGFFSVTGPSGPMLTRNGSFQTSADGTLVTTEGYPVRGAEGKPIKTQPSMPLEVGVDGVLRQGGEEINRLEIRDVKDLSALAKHGNSYFRIPDGAAAQPATPQVQQGKIENSNVATAESAVRLVSVMRQFEMLQKAISLAGEMNRRAVEEVAKVNP
ncbi:MAG: flagellar hook basal-body protein [Acidobacteria bacterium]|nr:flagellar hook basal-body protein [Acidobacteriota bacterium]MBI3472519.1 flagellar hook basal-body protein [Candidatus Solibacter usitatus]